MKKIVLIVIICLLIIGCCSNENRKNSVLSKEELIAYERSIIEYKNVTFQRCLFLGYNRSSEIRNLMKIDNSTHQDFAYGIEQYRYIDRIVGPIIEIARLDSIENYQRSLKNLNETEKNELNGKPIIKYCLDFYSSEKFDSIANQRTEQMKFLWQENE